VSTPVPPPGTETCGCCEGIEASTPEKTDNRPGLSAVAYRIGTYARFKESLTAGLSSGKRPALAKLLTRDSDDFTIGLLDAFSCAADVLTFYQERIANESYLRTATERVSLQEMAKLIGYRLRPGVAAETWLAFALEPPKTPPPDLPPEPGAFVTGIPTSLELAVGTKVQSVPGPDEKPQTFETVEEISARPEWNAIRPWMSAPHAPGRGATETWLKGIANNLKVGDALVFCDADFLAHPTTSTSWDFRLIDAVEVETAADRTHVSWQGGLERVAALADPPVPPQVYVLRKRAAVFGHNAPLWRSMNRTFRTDYRDGATESGEWPDFTISEKPASATGGYVDLDVALPEIKPGGLAVLTCVGFATARAGSTTTLGGMGLIGAAAATAVLGTGAIGAAVATAALGTGGIGTSVFGADVLVSLPRRFTELYRISSTTEVSLAAFALSGKVTRVGVQGQNLDTHFFNSVRETSVYTQSERLTLAPYPVLDAVAGNAIQLAVASDDLSAQRKVIVTGRRRAGGRTLVHLATIADAQSHPLGTVLTITPPLPHRLERDTLVVHANVALATHGETGSQILGAGDASRAFQRFELKRTPLTYRAAANEIGADSELTVRVGDIEWTERPRMFGAAATERSYTLSTDENDRTWVVFGDGQRGARLPSGVNNVRATYRQGLGKDGNVAAEKLTQLVSRPLGLKSVSNPAAASGGTDAEPADQARRTMPLGTRALGRAVSLLDYEDFALAFTGLAKAQARVLALAAGPTIAVTVAGQDGTQLSPGNPVWNNLLLALSASGDPHVSVVLLPYQASTFRLGLKVKRDPAHDANTVLAAVETALRAHYSFAARDLGQPVLQSDVIATVHSVPGVVAVDLDLLYGGTSPFAQTQKSRQRRLLATRMHVDGGLPRAAELLTLHSGPLDRLEEMT